MILKEEYSERNYNDPNLFKYEGDGANQLQALILEFIRREDESDHHKRNWNCKQAGCY